MRDDIRPYDRDLDLKAVDRIWREVGWLDPDDDIAPLDRLLEESNVEVGLIEQTAECAVAWAPGSMRYQHDNLPMCAVTAVTTSRIARKLGFATTLTARAIAAGAKSGAAVAALGMFDQGFYNRLGFGSAPYEYRFNFDPSALDVDHVPYRHPIRLGPDDAAEIHQCLSNRHRPHGSVALDPPSQVSSELRWQSKGFGLGYRAQGRLTHFIYGRTEGENGPYRIGYIGYEEPAQLLELLRLIKELGDQVTTFTMAEPAELQLQDLLTTPFRNHRQTLGSTHANNIETHPWMQLRILDLARCVSARRWSGPELSFNLTLSDPVSAIDNHDWAGVTGQHVVTVANPSSVVVGTDGALPTLEASINAFSRLWFGVLPASNLALTDDLTGPDDLLAALDEANALPTPRPGWYF